MPRAKYGMKEKIRSCVPEFQLFESDPHIGGWWGMIRIFCRLTFRGGMYWKSIETCGRFRSRQRSGAGNKKQRIPAAAAHCIWLPDLAAFRLMTSGKHLTTG